jgi:hypothetical protein
VRFKRKVPLRFEGIDIFVSWLSVGGKLGLFRHASERWHPDFDELRFSPAVLLELETSFHRYGQESNISSVKQC